jgi:hypothetical protein
MRIVFGGTLLALVLGTSATLWAQELVPQERASQSVSTLINTPAVYEGSETALVQTAPSATTTGDGEHKFGLGVRAGGYDYGIGVSVRSWFQSPWGLQIGLSRHSYGTFLGSDYSETLFAPAVLFEFAPIKMNAPLSLRPYAGAGVSVTRLSFNYFSNVNTTQTSVLILGGVELFFEQVPHLGVSGELEFTPSATPYANYNGIGGVGFAGLAHWYFM